MVIAKSLLAMKTSQFLLGNDFVSPPIYKQLVKKYSVLINDLIIFCFIRLVSL